MQIVASPPKKIMYKFLLFVYFLSARQQLSFGQHSGRGVVLSIGLSSRVQVQTMVLICEIYLWLKIDTRANNCLDQQFLQYAPCMDTFEMDLALMMNTCIFLVLKSTLGRRLGTGFKNFKLIDLFNLCQLHISYAKHVKIFKVLDQGKSVSLFTW